jgi:predicted ATPase
VTMRKLPQGTVTLLFTDIAGSTRLLEELGDGYSGALAEHRRLLRDAFERHGGVEVDTQGDAFFVAFAAASEALAAATDAQSALRSGPIKVRIGIHTGEPELADDGYVGLDVHRAARIAGAGHGGQIVASQSTRELVGTDGLLDLGEHRLKDVGSLRLYQVGTERFPPLRSLSQSNLPIPPTELLGRRDEVDELVELLRGEARLVTLVGTGGIGKTRLAVEAAAELVADFEDGVWFVDLSAVRDPQLVAPAIAAALGTPAELADHVRHRELLLVLDNLEQVLAAASELGLLLEGSPRLSLLVTSREPLRLRAERELPLRPLADEPAAQLFRERANAIEPGFAGDEAQVAGLCRRLDGIPLAIELAAARVKILAPDQLLSRLERRLPMLIGGARDAPERQRTLRSTIEWSYDLLDEDERRLFASLSVFAGGWTFEAAEEVCDADLDTLHSLVDKSLARVEEGRFRMLETIREYAAERLEESGDVDELRRRHAAFFLALAERAEPELTGGEQHVWLDRLAAEHENLRAALDWYSADSRLAPDGLRFAKALVLFWFTRGFYREALRYLQHMLAATDDERTTARAGALWGAGFFWSLFGDEGRSRPLLEQSLALASELGDESSTARCLEVLGLFAFFANESRRACELMEQSAELARKVGDLWCLADALRTLSSFLPLQGEADHAEALGREALAIAERAADPQGRRMALFGLGLAAVRRGDLSSARTRSDAGLAISREIGDRWFVSYFLWLLATVSLWSGDRALARKQAEESLEVAREMEGPLLLVCALDVLGEVARAEGDDDEAVAHLREAETIARGAIVPHSYLASVLRHLGEIAATRGDDTEARGRLAEALALAEGVGDSWEADRARSALRGL